MTWRIRAQVPAERRSYFCKGDGGRQPSRTQPQRQAKSRGIRVGKVEQTAHAERMCAFWLTNVLKKMNGVSDEAFAVVIKVHGVANGFQMSQCDAKQLLGLFAQRKLILDSHDHQVKQLQRVQNTNKNTNKNTNTQRKQTLVYEVGKAESWINCHLGLNCHLFLQGQKQRGAQKSGERDRDCTFETLFVLRRMMLAFEKCSRTAMSCD